MRPLLLLLLLLTGPAFGQEAGLLGRDGKPVAIEADTLEWHQDSQTYVARGKAKVRQDKVTVSAEVLTAHYAAKPGGSNEIVKVEAEGGVVIKGEAQEAFGAHGVYDVATGVAVLTGGDLRFVAGEDVVTARDRLEFDARKNVARAVGAAKAVQGERTVSAETLTATLEKDKAGKLGIRRVEAVGQVMLLGKDEVAQADRGVYDLHRKVATLEGNVRITRGKNQLNGARAEMDLNSGVSRIVAGPGRQVKALLVPGKDMPEVKP